MQYKYYEVTINCTTWEFSPLHPRWGVWAAAAVLQLSVQELPRSAAWHQPLLLHLRAAQVLQMTAMGSRPDSTSLQTAVKVRWLMSHRGLFEDKAACAFFFFFAFRSCLLDRLLMSTLFYSNRSFQMAINLREKSRNNRRKWLVRPRLASQSKLCSFSSWK